MLPKIVAAVIGLATLLSGQVGWVAETPHFRIVASPEVQLERDDLAAAADHLEKIRSQLAAASLSPRRSSDERQNILLVPTVADIRSLVGGLAGPTTRGLTINGADRNLVLIAWHAAGDAKVALAHEYAHLLDDSAWPRWFVEGRAEHLARYPSGDAPNHLARLLLTEWFELSEVLGSSNEGTPPESFYAASWLLFDWLLQREGNAAGVRPEAIGQAIDELGLDGVDSALWQHAEKRRAAPPRQDEIVKSAASNVVVRAIEQWEIPLFKAEVSHAVGDLERASAGLNQLVQNYPDVFQVHAARGLVAIVTNDYDIAESELAKAVELGDRRAVTAYRYTLMLMRPGSDTSARALAAVENSQRARDRAPDEPRYQLAAAQAQMLAGEWDLAFEELRRLAEFPGWSDRADREAGEVRRRRGQRLARHAAPPLADSGPSAVTYQPKIAKPDPLPAAPPEPSKPARQSSWPPPGTTLVYGRIGWVECSGAERTIVLSTPRLRLVLRENPKSPPRLIFPPLKWKQLPCETYGWTVNIAYKPLRGAGEVKGEVVAIRF